MPRAKRRTLTQSGRCAVRLTAAAGQPTDNGARWIQIAYEGAWKGYTRGEFELAQADLQQMVDNFHKHPSFRPGAEAATRDQLLTCSYDVVPFDWQHLSTSPSGDTPLELQVAQAWACDLRVQPGADGAELWAYCRYLPKMGELVATGAVHWTSITATPHGVDPETGADRGWELEAIAFTNNPFLQGMRVAADRKGGRRAQAELFKGYDPYSPPSTPEDVLECLRGLLELPATADIAQVFAEIAKLKQWATAGGAPPGVDLDELVGCLRQVFNLPTLANTAEVFAAADGLLAALTAAADTEPQSDRGPLLTRTRESHTMNPLLRKLLDKLSASGLSLGRASTDEDALEAILEAIGKQRISLEKGGDATAGLSAILQALGVEDVGGATKKIAEMFKSVDQLEKAMPELKALREQQETEEDQGAEKDVGETMTAHKLPLTAKPALLAMRTGGFAKHELDKRRSAKAAFFAAYPPVDPRALALTQPAFPLAGVGAPLSLARPVQGEIANATLGIGGAVLIDLSGFEGNNTERALAFLEKRGDFAPQRGIALSRPARFKLASNLLKQPNVVGIDR